MQLKRLTVIALAGTAVAQSTMGLVDTLKNQTDLSTLISFLGNYSSVVSALGSLSNITLLAPSNEAFSALMNSSAASMLSNSDYVAALLNYHVLNGTYANITNTTFIPTALMPGMFANVTGGQRVEAVESNGNITFYSGLLTNSSAGAAINFTGGTIHIINRFLMVPENVTQTAIDFNLTAAVGALETLKLAATIDSLQDLTLFVPNNEAFQSIGSAVGNLTMERLTGILSYHAVSGMVGYSTMLKNDTMLKTVEGSNVTVYVNGSDIFVNNAKVVFPDVLVANGVVHVIDEVLNPMNSSAMPSDNMGDNAFPGTSNSTDVPFTSGVPTPTSAIMTSAIASAKSSAAGSSTSNPGWIAANPTGAMAPLALFGGAAVFMNM